MMYEPKTVHKRGHYKSHAKPNIINVKNEPQVVFMALNNDAIKEYGYCSMIKLYYDGLKPSNIHPIIINDFDEMK